ncbi:YoaK family protein [Methylobacterium oryzisoli]|uniref:YoaK family protein n=1 Tax=Methylobacterium oryzisoli TaxID=3385502 RepID=UPI003891CE7B
MPVTPSSPARSGLPLRDAALGLALTATAGWIDAIGFLRLGGLYTSFMSGNTTQFAVALGQADGAGALPVGALLAAFAGGSVLGGLARGAAPAQWVAALVLTLEALLLGTATALALASPDALPATLLLAFAMGAQNAALVQVAGFRAGTTFVTGALSGFGQKLGLALAGRGPRWDWAGDGVVWIGLLLGGVGGAAAYGQLALAALLPPAVLTAALAVGLLAAALRRTDP